MKKNKIFIGLAVGIGAYLLWNLKRKKSSGVVEQVKETVAPTPEVGETRSYFKSKDGRILQCPKGKIGGTKDNPSSFCTDQQINKKITDVEKTRLFKDGNYYYRGGARPSQDLIDSIKEKRDKALSEINRLGLYTEFSAWRKKENNKNSNLMPPMSIKTMEYGKPILLKRI